MSETDAGASDAGFANPSPAAGATRLESNNDIALAALSARSSVFGAMQMTSTSSHADSALPSLSDATEASPAGLRWGSEATLLAGRGRSASASQRRGVHDEELAQSAAVSAAGERRSPDEGYPEVEEAFAADDDENDDDDDDDEEYPEEEDHDDVYEDDTGDSDEPHTSPASSIPGSGARRPPSPCDHLVKVYARVRPNPAPSPGGSTSGGRDDTCDTPRVWCGADETSIGVHDAAYEGFSGVFTDTGNSWVYHTVATPLLQRVLEGETAAVVAYGASGSGKTHTLSHWSGGGGGPRAADGGDGMIFQAVAQLLEWKQADAECVCDIAVECVGVCDNVAYDLLRAGDAVGGGRAGVALPPARAAQEGVFALGWGARRQLAVKTAERLGGLPRAITVEETLNGVNITGLSRSADITSLTDLVETLQCARDRAAALAMTTGDVHTTTRVHVTRSPRGGYGAVGVGIGVRAGSGSAAHAHPVGSPPATPGTTTLLPHAGRRMSSGVGMGVGASIRRASLASQPARGGVDGTTVNEPPPDVCRGMLVFVDLAAYRPPRDGGGATRGAVSASAYAPANAPRGQRSFVMPARASSTAPPPAVPVLDLPGAISVYSDNATLPAVGGAFSGKDDVSTAVPASTLGADGVGSGPATPPPPADGNGCIFAIIDCLARRALAQRAGTAAVGACDSAHKESTLARLLTTVWNPDVAVSVIAHIDTAASSLRATQRTLFVAHTRILGRTPVSARDTAPATEADWEREALYWRQQAQVLQHRLTDIEVENAMLTSKLQSGGGGGGAVSPLPMRHVVTPRGVGLSRGTSMASPRTGTSVSDAGGETEGDRDPLHAPRSLAGGSVDGRDHESPASGSLTPRFGGLGSTGGGSVPPFHRSSTASVGFGGAKSRGGGGGGIAPPARRNSVPGSRELSRRLSGVLDQTAAFEQLVEDLKKLRHQLDAAEVARKAAEQHNVQLARDAVEAEWEAARAAHHRAVFERDFQRVRGLADEIAAARDAFQTELVDARKRLSEVLPDECFSPKISPVHQSMGGGAGGGAPPDLFLPTAESNASLAYTDPSPVGGAATYVSPLSPATGGGGYGGSPTGSVSPTGFVLGGPRRKRVQRVYLKYERVKYALWRDLIRAETERHAVHGERVDRAHWYVSIPDVAELLADDRMDYKSCFTQKPTSLSTDFRPEDIKNVRVTGLPLCRQTLKCEVRGVDLRLTPGLAVAWEISATGFDFAPLPPPPAPEPGEEPSIDLPLSGDTVHRYVRAKVSLQGRTKTSKMVYVNIDQSMDDQLQHFVTQGGVQFPATLHVVNEHHTGAAARLGTQAPAAAHTQCILSFECSGKIALKAANASDALWQSHVGNIGVACGADKRGLVITDASIKQGRFEEAFTVRLELMTGRDRDLVVLTARLFQVLRKAWIAEALLGEVSAMWMKGSWVKSKDAAARRALQLRLRSVCKTGHCAVGVASPPRKAGGETTFLQRAEELHEIPYRAREGPPPILAPADDASLAAIPGANASTFTVDTSMSLARARRGASNVQRLGSCVFPHISPEATPSSSPRMDYHGVGQRFTAAHIHSPMSPSDVGGAGSGGGKPAPPAAEDSQTPRSATASPAGPGRKAPKRATRGASKSFVFRRPEKLDKLEPPPALPTRGLDDPMVRTSSTRSMGSINDVDGGDASGVARSTTSPTSTHQTPH